MKISYKIFLFTFLVISTSYSKVWNVGNTRQYQYCSEISSLVADGDTIYIDRGTYQNDLQVTWSKNNLYISGLNGVPILVAGDKIANDNSNGKGIFVIKGNNTRVENIEFQNAKVLDHNGAGIRQEGSNLYVSHCIFNSNEMGILQGGTIPNCTIKIEFCKFSNNGSSANPGYQHNIYINHIDSLIFQYNYTYDAIAQGHELKSRADNNFILYNKIANYTSEDSRNIDLPNGGTAVIMGNIIVQGPNSANTNIIGYGLEGNINKPPHNIWICNNTIVNNMNRGSFVDVENADTLLMYNNICVGPKTAGFIIGNYKMTMLPVLILFRLLIMIITLQARVPLSIKELCLISQSKDIYWCQCLNMLMNYLLKQEHLMNKLILVLSNFLKLMKLIQQMKIKLKFILILQQIILL
jgi:hypothetical protein